MNLTPAQNSFTSGEITPLLRDRTDTEGHAQACAILRNMIVQAHGPATTRPALKFVDTIATITDARVITFQADVDEYWALVFSNLSIATFKNLNGVWSVGPVFVSVYTSAQVHDVHFTIEPDRSFIEFYHKSHEPRYLSYNGTTFTGTLTLVSFTAKPWTTPRPSTGTIRQGRLWLFNGVNIYGTKPQSRADFTVGTGTPNDSVVVEMDDFGSVLWAYNAKELIFGSDQSEYLITSVGGLIYAGDIDQGKHSSYGSARLQSFMMGDKVSYITGDGRKLMLTQYDDGTEQWLPEEASFLSEHITEGVIKSYAWTPHNQFLAWFGLADGEFLSMTYNRTVNVMGWSQHQTQGDVKSVASGEINGVGETIMLVHRSDATGDELFIEVTSNDQKMDSFIEITQASSTTVVGLDHLNGFEIDLIVDGALHPQRTVTGGTVELDYAGTEIVAGLRFTQELETLPKDAGSQTGSGRGHTKRWKDLMVSLVDSAVPKINGTYPPDRHASTPMGEPEPLLTKLVKVNDLTYDRDAIINIKQELPLPLTVSGIFGKLTQERA